MSRRDEFKANSTNKRGVVVERDPTKQRVRVQFEDEDEGVSAWVDVLSSSSGGTSAFMMPGDGDEVWCAMDAKGEDGCIMGSKYNDSEKPPSSTNEDITLTGPWGTVNIDGSNLSVTITGDMTFTANGNISIKAGGNIALEAGGSITTTSGGDFTHNCKNIGHTHKHKDVATGPAQTGEPA